MNIPVSDLRRLAYKLDLSHVIMLAHDCDGVTDHVATYGRTLEQCSEAADFGNRLKDALGWPESLRAQPPRVVKLQLEIDLLNAYLDSLGDVAAGGDLMARVQAVVSHYTTQALSQAMWLKVEVERSPAETHVTVFEPYLSVYGVGATIKEALTEFESMLLDLYEELESSEETLSESLRRQLTYLREHFGV